MRRAHRDVVLGLYRSGPARRLLEHALSLGVRSLDTACNYHRFASHRALARVAGDLLGEFVLYTKVGFFANGDPTWDPRSVVKVIDQDAPGIQPRALLLRAGLSVAHPVLSAGEQMCRVLRVAPDRRWGMSPFSGSTSDGAWRAANLGAFLQPEQPCSALQAAFRLAYELPPVARVAVGTSNPAHLRELVAATKLMVNDDAIGRYRQLIQTPVGTAAES